MKMTLATLAECFGNVIVDYHNTIMVKHGDMAFVIEDPSAFLREENVYEKLERRCEKVNQHWRNRETHLRFFRIVFEELNTFNSGINQYVTDLLQLIEEDKQDEILAKQSCFLDDCHSLKADLKQILIDLYQLNHQGQSILMKFNTKKFGTIRTERFNLSATTKSFSSLYRLPDMGLSIRTHLLLKLELSHLMVKTPESIAKEKVNEVFDHITETVDRLLRDKCLKQKKGVDQGSPKSKQAPLNPLSELDRASVEALIKRGHTLASSKELGDNDATGTAAVTERWCLSSLLGFTK
jgi:hypothetical protein